ncbi:MAG: DNA adenine methylase [Bacteroidetes bacterium]|nr:DNA adenine methylase [Bacteroidota bacterium]
MLFEEYTFFNHQFPEPQYLGAKHTHLPWLNKHVPSGVKTALDAFGGSQSVAFLFKQLGFEILTNDFLNFNHQIGLSLIENKDCKILESDVKMLFNQSSAKGQFSLIAETYSDIFFEREEAEFLDNFRANVNDLDNSYKQALAFTVMNRALTRKVTMGHFAHTQALNYANNPDRIKRNRSLARPIKDIFLDLLPKYNAAVFDNKQENRSFNMNTLELMPDLPKMDLAYFDPPYCDSHADYQSFYHLLETFTVYWKDKEFVNSIRRYEPQRYSGFDKKKTALDSLEYLFELSDEIPHWLISYNDRSYPSVDDLQKMVGRYRDVQVEAKTYQNGRGGKGSVAGSREILIICKPKKKHPVKIGTRLETVADEGF